MQEERASTVIQALARAINELKRARTAIGNIEPNDEYIWIELCYMLTNTYRNLEGFLNAHLKGEQTKMFG